MVNPYVSSVYVTKTEATVGDTIDVIVVVTNYADDSGLIDVWFEDTLNGSTVGGRSLVTNIGPWETISVTFEGYTLRYSGSHQICGYAEPY